jgi:hypothetical protein
MSADKPLGYLLDVVRAEIWHKKPWERKSHCSSPRTPTLGPPRLIRIPFHIRSRPCPILIHCRHRVLQLVRQSHSFNPTCAQPVPPRTLLDKGKSSCCCPSFRHIIRTMSRRVLTLLVFVLVSHFAFSPSAAAQTVPGTLQPQAQLPGSISPIQPSSAPTSGLPANVLTPSSTSQLAPNPGIRAAPAPFTSAGRGLPGMQGGPPVNGPVGAQDPSSSFMRPPTIGPLFCDPALNIQC